MFTTFVMPILFSVMYILNLTVFGDVETSEVMDRHEKFL